MPRAIEWEETVDTSMFSAVQLQSGVIASLTWNGVARWLRTYLVSFPTLITQKHMGLVVMGFHLEYRDPISFFECETFRARGALRMMRRGERGQFDLRLFTETNELAITQLIVRPVAILDPISLGAEPAPLSDALLEQFETDEVESPSPARMVPARVTAVEAQGELLAESSKPFRIHRHLSEVAEQWSWTETPGLIESARENMALDNQGEHKMMLRRCLRRRIARFDIEFSRPFFSFEDGEIVSRAYEVAGHLAFVHRFISNQGTHLHATAVEVFDS